MRFVFTSLTFAAVLGMAACANNPNRPTDTGSMQTPASPPAGVIGTNSPPVDTGSMAPVTGSGGVVVRQPRGADTGSMALPSAAQGNSAPRRY